MSLQCCNPFAAVNATVLKLKDGSTPREFFFLFASFELCILLLR